MIHPQSTHVSFQDWRLAHVFLNNYHLFGCKSGPGGLWWVHSNNMGDGCSHQHTQTQLTRLYDLSFWCKCSFDQCKSLMSSDLQVGDLYFFISRHFYKSVLRLPKGCPCLLTCVRACGRRGITKLSVTGKCHLNLSQKLYCKLCQTMKPGEGRV